MTVLDLVLPATVGWERAGVNFKTGHHYTPAKTRKMEKLIKDAWIASGALGWPAESPVALYLTFYKARPPSHYRADGVRLNATGRSHGVFWMMQRPDLDNLEKIVMDALNGVAFVDDKQIVWKWGCKRWATDGLDRLAIELKEAVE